MSIFKDWSLSATVAGFVTVLVGFSSSAAIVFQAAHSLGATPEELGSWMGALGLGMGLTCILPSLYYRRPIVTAWSTPGAAMLVTGAAGVSMPDAIGAFVVSAILIALFGFTGLFERVLKRIPMSIASGMLAGVLLKFGMDVFKSMQQLFSLCFPMFMVYLVGRRAVPRYAVPLTLLAGAVIAWSQGLLHFEQVQFEWVHPVWIKPHFELAAIISVGLPLFAVTMASQNAPGIAVIRASGYQTPVSASIGWTGIATLVLAPFGGYALNLAAITAAICMGREAHEDPSRRYIAAVAAGIFYLMVGAVGATVVAVFAAFPKELILTIAGLALLGTIGNGLAAALTNDKEREPALVAFLVTASGMTLLGVGSAFWGLVAGSMAMLLSRLTRENLIGPSRAS